MVFNGDLSVVKVIVLCKQEINSWYCWLQKTILYYYIIKSELWQNDYFSKTEHFKNKKVLPNLTDGVTTIDKKLGPLDKFLRETSIE